MPRTALWIITLLTLAIGGLGCHSPSVTAVSLNARHCDHPFAWIHDPCSEPEGIPFYLPKPLLIISKNFRNIEETKVGLTDGAPIPNYYDDQAKYADLNARTNFSGLDGNAAAGTPATTSAASTTPSSATGLATAAGARIYSSNGAPVTPGATPPDGLKPEAFFTYHIIFVPDLTQKYGLKIKGGAGEIRAAMNLVNGWQFTGLGPYYMKDSSTAQNTLASGITANLAASGVADVVKQIASLKPTAGASAPSGTTPQNALPPPTVPVDAATIQAMSDAMRELNPKLLSIPSYAEISIYEPYLSPEGTMEWKLIAEKSFERNVVTTEFSGQQVMNMLSGATQNGAFSGAVNDSTAKGIDVNTSRGPVKVPPAAVGPANPPAAPEPVKPQGPANAPGKPVLESPELVPIPDRKGLNESTRLMPGLRVPSAASVQGARMIPAQGGVIRSSMRTPSPEAGQVDGDIIRARMQGAELPPPSDHVEPIRLGLSAATDTGQEGDGITESTRPQITVKNAPPNSTFLLLRDGQRVNVFRTQAVVPPLLTIPDDYAPIGAGEHKYEVVRIGSGNRREVLAQYRMRVFKTPNPSQTPAMVATIQSGISAPAGTIDGGTPAGTLTANNANPPANLAVTTAAVASNDIVRQVLTQFTTPASTKTLAPLPAPTVVTSATHPASGNQINLNQFFGKTKLTGDPAQPQERFSLFHHKAKQKRTIRSLEVDGIDADVAAISAASTANRAPINNPAITNPGSAGFFQKDTSLGTVETPEKVITPAADAPR